MINEMNRLCEVLEDEVSNVNKKLDKSGGALSGDDISYIDKLTHAIKSIKTTIAMVEAEDGGSGAYPYYHMGSYNRGGSYARRRDSMGRYSRDDGMISELRELMKEAPDERTRQEFRTFIDKIERM